jgi:hypothetical protein
MDRQFCRKELSLGAMVCREYLCSWSLGWKGPFPTRRGLGELRPRQPSGMPATPMQRQGKGHSPITKHSWLDGVSNPGPEKALQHRVRDLAVSDPVSLSTSRHQRSASQAVVPFDALFFTEGHPSPQSLTSGFLESPGAPLSLAGKQDPEVAHPFPEAVACTGDGLLGKSGAWGPDPLSGGLLDVLGVGAGGTSPGEVDMSGFCAAPPPHRAGSKRPTGPSVPRHPQGPGPPLGVSEENIQTTPT